MENTENKYVEILTDANPHLRQKCEPVELPLSPEDEETLGALLKYVTDSRDEELVKQYGLIPACGLAAPQIGINKQMFAVVLDEKVGKDQYKTVSVALANPKIISNSVQKAYMSNGEGCLSVKDPHEGYIYRSARITIKGYDYFTKKEVKIRATGYLAIAIQHEYDHLSGILFYDRIDKKNPFALIEGAIEV